MQKSLSNNPNTYHRIQFMHALRNGIKKGDLTEHQAEKLRKEYDE